jgi:hypothetical protein
MDHLLLRRSFYDATGRLTERGSQDGYGESGSLFAPVVARRRKAAGC